MAGESYSTLPQEGKGGEDKLGNSERGQAETPKGAAFKDLHVSNFFDGSDPLAILKIYVPTEVVVGVGALAAVVLPRIGGYCLAGLLLLPPVIRLVLRCLGWMRNPQMDRVIRPRTTARIEGDFCVLLIGFRNNAPWKFSSKFKKVGDAFMGMIKELESLPPEESGYLGAETYLGANKQRSSHGLTVIYWRSFEDMMKYVHNPNMKHMPAWTWAAKETKASPDLGLWHEAYLVANGKYDAVYMNCPPMGLGMCNKLEPAVGRFRSSRGRAGMSDGKDLPTNYAGAES